jgi:hypothetical protein
MELHAQIAIKEYYYLGIARNNEVLYLFRHFLNAQLLFVLIGVLSEWHTSPCPIHHKITSS